jgi:secreted trypsin-like serine protease
MKNSSNLVVFSFVAALSLSACQASHQFSVGGASSGTGIVNGVLAQSTDVAPQGVAESVVLIVAKIKPQGVALCSGTLIAPQVVLTAGHCVPNGAAPADIRVGLHYLDISAKPRPSFVSGYGVKSFVVNPDFLKPSPESASDLAILLLDKPVPAGTRVASLPTADSDPSTLTSVLTIGYGQADEKHSATEAQQGAGILRYTTFPQAKFGVLPASSSIPADMQGMIVAKADTTSVCHGDSGGPLMAEANGTSLNVVVGVNDAVLPSYQGQQQTDYLAAEKVGTQAAIDAFYAKYPDANVCSGGLNLFVNVASRLPWIQVTAQGLLNTL